MLEKHNTGNNSVNSIINTILIFLLHSAHIKKSRENLEKMAHNQGLQALCA